MRDCPEHPGQDTMVPCLGCGRSFCRICHEPRGAGQYCPACFLEQLKELQEKSGRAEPPSAAEPGRRKGLRKTLRGRLSRRSEAPPVMKDRQKKSWRAPFRRAGAGVRGAWDALRRAALFIAGLPSRAALYLSWRCRWTWRLARDRWPFCLAPRESLEGNPPFRQAWWKLLACVAGGIVLWIAVVWLTGIRNPGFSIGVALVVSGGVVWSMGSKYGPTTGIVCAGLALVTLVMAEFLTQVLFRVGLIHKLDLQLTGLISLEKPRMFYGTFVFRLVVYRLLPSAALAWLIGWWPFKRRFGWFGFAGRGLEPVQKRPRKAAGPGEGEAGHVRT